MFCFDAQFGDAFGSMPISCETGRVQEQETHGHVRFLWAIWSPLLSHLKTWAILFMVSFYFSMSRPFFSFLHSLLYSLSHATTFHCKSRFFVIFFFVDNVLKSRLLFQFRQDIQTESACIDRAANELREIIHKLQKNGIDAWTVVDIVSVSFFPIPSSLLSQFLRRCHVLPPPRPPPLLLLLLFIIWCCCGMFETIWNGKIPFLSLLHRIPCHHTHNFFSLTLS